MKTYEITCQHCGGIGHRALTGVYAETLHGISRRCRRFGEYVVANRDWKWLGSPSGPALSNRLVRLEEMGFLRSETFGRQRRFYLRDKNGGR